MAENTFKPKPENESSAEKKEPRKAWSLFSPLERLLGLERYFEEGFPIRHFPRIMFIFLIGLIYIWNSHSAERTIREIDQAQSDVEDLRADFTTQKAALMLSGKQSEVAKRVRGQGLEEELAPPIKVEIDPEGF